MEYPGGAPIVSAAHCSFPCSPGPERQETLISPDDTQIAHCHCIRFQPSHLVSALRPGPISPVFDRVCKAQVTYLLLTVRPLHRRYRGVSRKKLKWEAKVMVQRKWAYRGLFATEEAAGRVYSPDPCACFLSRRHHVLPAQPLPDCNIAPGRNIAAKRMHRQSHIV